MALNRRAGCAKTGGAKPRFCAKSSQTKILALARENQFGFLAERRSAKDAEIPPRSAGTLPEPEPRRSARSDHIIQPVPASSLRLVDGELNINPPRRASRKRPSGPKPKDDDDDDNELNINPPTPCQ